MQVSYKELSNLLKTQRSEERAMRATTAQERIERLLRLQSQIRERAADIGRAIYSDLGRPAENRDEADTVLRNIDVAVKNLATWMQPVEVVASSPVAPRAKRIYIQHEPRGVVLLLGTWDFPIGMLFSPLIQAVSAGNCVICKPSDMTPATSRLSAEIIRAVFPEKEVAVVLANEVTGAEDADATIYDALLRLPVDHIFLTGSPKNGRAVVAAAARHLATFTLELGGKSPAILDETADLDLVAREFLALKIYNHGQTCLSVDYVWVPKQTRDSLVAKFGAAVRKAYYEKGVYQAERDARFVNRKNFERVKGYLDQAVQRGARVVFGGQCDADRLVIEPTVVVDVPLDSDLIREEIFGPVLPVMSYEHPDEIFDHSRTLGKPLGMYIFSQNEDFIQRVLANTSSGGVTVNGQMYHWLEENLPFGGVNTSGYGRYHGEYGFRELSNTRSIFHVAT